MKRISIALAFVLMAGASYAQSLNVAKLDSLFNIMEAKNKLMGSVTISQNGKTVYSRSIGKADVETNKKNTAATKYRVGSVTKTFTACLVLKAVEEGKLSLTQKIDKYFPTVENAAKISIENLLYHRSGIYSFPKSEEFQHYYTETKSKKEMIDIIAKGKSVFDPDSAYEYSNSNYVLLSFILEDAYHKSFSEILNEKIIKPLGLKNTYFGHDAILKNNEAYSYGNESSGQWVKAPETDMTITMGAGCLISNSADLAIFMEGLFTNKIISAKSREQMLQLKENHGMGIDPFRLDNKQGFGHFGAIDGSSSSMFYFPDDQLAISTTSNGDVLGTRYLMKAVASICFEKPYEIPAFKTIAVTSEDLDKYTGVYSTPEIPDFSIIISKDSLTLTAQGTGEPALPFEAIEKDQFEFLRAGIKLEFNPAENLMFYSKGGETFKMMRKVN
jgi:CubicO group peptidase (beta-lactamase class C family)